jgi:hypothetical protein
MLFRLESDMVNPRLTRLGPSQDVRRDNLPSVGFGAPQVGPLIERNRENDISRVSHPFWTVPKRLDWSAPCG